MSAVVTAPQIEMIHLLSEALQAKLGRIDRQHNQSVVHVLFTCPDRVALVAVRDGGDWWHEGAPFEKPLPEGLGATIGRQPIEFPPIDA